MIGRTDSNFRLCYDLTRYLHRTFRGSTRTILTHCSPSLRKPSKANGLSKDFRKLPSLICRMCPSIRRFYCSQSCCNLRRTYRFGTNLSMDSMGYDLKSIRSSTKFLNFISNMILFRRKPAWTDRILYMHGTTCQVHQLSYTCHPQIIMSDHRPVSADFTVDVSLKQTYVERVQAYGMFHRLTSIMQTSFKIVSKRCLIKSMIYNMKVREIGES
jgi:hypothetical protein